MSTKTFARVAMIAAIYTVLTLCLAPISFGNFQIRISEALTMLPLIYQPSIIGVTLGCFLSNLVGAMTGMNPTGMLDSVIGTLATLGAAYCTWKLRDVKIGKLPLLSMAMPVIWNFVFVGAELGYMMMPENVILGTVIFGAEVAVGEIIAVILGYFVNRIFIKTKIFEK
jgi:Predicted membrane protein